MSTDQASRPRSVGQAFGVLCVLVVCERCAAYILASSLVVMLTERYLILGTSALRLAALLGVCTYLGTLPAGWLIDKAMGPRRAMLVSGALLALGYGLLTLSASSVLWVALPLLALGSAIFRPATQAIISGIFHGQGKALDSALIRFYMAVNLGAAIGAILAGIGLNRLGWVGLFAIATGIVFSASALFAVEAPKLHTMQATPASKQSVEMTSPQRIRGIAAVMLATMVYVMSWSQVEGAILLWVQGKDRSMLGYTIPSAWFVAVPSLLAMLLLGAQLSIIGPLRKRLGAYRLVALGLFFLALAFVTLLPAVSRPIGHTTLAWLVACLGIMVVGEVLVTTLGLGLVLRLAPPRFTALVAGGWYFMNACGSWLAGEIGSLWLIWSPKAAVSLLATVVLMAALIVYASTRGLPDE